MKEELENFFIENHDGIRKSKNEINKTFKKFNIDFHYDFDTFCKDFLQMTSTHNINYYELSDIHVVSKLIADMMINRIPIDKLELLKQDENFLKLVSFH